MYWKVLGNPFMDLAPIPTPRDKLKEAELEMEMMGEQNAQAYANPVVPGVNPHRFSWIPDENAEPLRHNVHHEQSETVQNEKGEWINIYGRNTPQAGQRLPGTPTYPTVEEAVEAAKKRSREHDQGSEKQK